MNLDAVMDGHTVKFTLETNRQQFSNREYCTSKIKYTVMIPWTINSDKWVVRGMCAAVII